MTADFDGLLSYIRFFFEKQCVVNQFPATKVHSKIKLYDMHKLTKLLKYQHIWTSANKIGVVS